MPIEFWFEFASTYSYPASQRVEALARERGVDVVWRAFLLGPIFHTQGWNDSPFNLYPVKGRYMWRDMERICAAQGVDFRKPSEFPRNGLTAARVTCHHAEEPWVPEFVRRVYHANFADDRNIASPEVLTDCLNAAGADAETVLAAAVSPDSKQALRTQSEEAAERGLFGAPSFLVGDELFWGNDRLEAALNWATQA
ncbi:MAG: 2-hydroxychromene-2-carboxylate isomerase [Myxococcota bacterium]